MVRQAWTINIKPCSLMFLILVAVKTCVVAFSTDLQHTRLTAFLNEHLSVRNSMLFCMCVKCSPRKFCYMFCISIFNGNYSGSQMDEEFIWGASSSLEEATLWLLQLIAICRRTVFFSIHPSHPLTNSPQILYPSIYSSNRIIHHLSFYHPATIPPSSRFLFCHIYSIDSSVHPWIFDHNSSVHPSSVYHVSI